MELIKRHTFVSLKNLDLSNSEIAEKLGLSDRTVRRWSVLHENGSLFTVKKQTGRPLKATARQMRALKKAALENGVRSAHEICRDANLHVCRRTAASYMKKLGFNLLTRPLVCDINDFSRERRVIWATEHIDRPQSFWNSVLWTDETMVCLRDGYGPSKSWTTKTLKFIGNNPRTRRKFGGRKVMFWGCFLASGERLLLPIEGIMNAEKYSGMLREHVFPWIVAMEAKLGIKIVFQQDFSRVHTARLSREAFESNDVELLPWVPYSPDLNPIEHLWAFLKSKIGGLKTRPNCIEDLKRSAIDEWNRISPSVCQSLVNSMQSRIREVIASNGGPTRY